MIRVNDYIMLESQEDFNKYWDEGWQRFDNALMNEKPIEYPVFYKYSKPWDSHFCGDWIKIDKIKFRLAIKKEIENYKEKLRFLEKTLDKVN